VGVEKLFFVGCVLRTYYLNAIKLNTGAQAFSLLFQLYQMKAKAFAPKSIADIS